MVSTYMNEVQDNVFLHSKQCDPKQSHNHQLDRTDFTQHRPVGDQASGHTEVSVDQAEEGKENQMSGTHVG